MREQLDIQLFQGFRYFARYSIFNDVEQIHESSSAFFAALVSRILVHLRLDKPDLRARCVLLAGARQELR